MARKKKIEEPKIAIVEDNPDLVRDLATNAIINTNDTAYEARLNQIAKAEEFESMKKDIGEIKEIKGRFTVNIPRPDIRFDYNLSGGAFMDPGCYLVHALVHFFEDFPEIVSTEVKRDKTDSRIDIKSKAELLIGGKTKAEIYSSIESKKDMEIWIEFLGEEGSLKIDNYVRSEWGKLCLRGKDNITKEESFSSKSTFSHQ